MDVELERPGEGIALARITRPEARNAINQEVRQALAEAFTQWAADDNVRVAIVTGSDKVFAAGADLKAFATATTAEIAAMPDTWAPLRAFSKPVIAAVNGWALGGGCELAMHCDLIVAGEGARFGQPEIRVGIMPGAGGTQRLTRAVGKFKAMRMLLTGEPVGAREAEAMGLVSEVVPDGEVMARALVLAATIAAMPPIAVRRIKEMVLTGPDLPLEAALKLERRAFETMFSTQDQKEGMAAFLAKRPPRFEGR